MSRHENEELFSLVIGGYGLFGVILDVELQLTDQAIYEVQHEHMLYTDYPAFFQEQVLGNTAVELHIARLSTAPSSLLTEMYASNYVRIEEKEESETFSQEGVSDLKQEENIERNKFVFGLARKYDWGKNRLWDLQKVLYSPDKKEILSRNNAMRPEVRFLDYVSDHDTDILQEYFIPVEKFASFIDGLRGIVEEEELNVFNITVRYVPKNEEAMLSYAQKESLAIVLLINQGLSEQSIAQTEQATQRMVELAIEYDGTYYLAYQLYPSLEQLSRVYPQHETFFEKKREYDPDERFMNKFYERYGKYGE
nr:D-arabinono-1,4-lactone oxidase [Caldalkalibacillus mannanilyticus]